MLLKVCEFAEQPFSRFKIGLMRLFGCIEGAKPIAFFLVHYLCPKSMRTIGINNTLQSRLAQSGRFAISGVFVTRAYTEIIAPVVKMISVDMIALFVIQQRPTEFSFEDYAMQKHLFSEDTSAGILVTKAPAKTRQIGVNSVDYRKSLVSKGNSNWIKQGKLCILRHDSLLTRLSVPRLLKQRGDFLYYTVPSVYQIVEI